MKATVSVLYNVSFNRLIIELNLYSLGAFFIQSLVEKFSDLHSETNKYFDGKECDNVLMMTAQLYNFKVCLINNYFSRTWTSSKSRIAVNLSPDRNIPPSHLPHKTKENRHGLGVS